MGDPSWLMVLYPDEPDWVKFAIVAGVGLVLFLLVLSQLPTLRRELALGIRTAVFKWSTILWPVLVVVVLLGIYVLWQ